MDKERVIGLSNRINEVVTNETPTSISWHKIAYASELLQTEINSKIVMPKVFDEWHKQTNKDSVAEQITELSSIAIGLEPYHGFNDEQLALQDWLTDDKDFLNCIDAIINGYEVEK